MATAALQDRRATISIHPWSAWQQLAPIWSELVAASGCCSFSLSETWVETWLQVFGPQLQPSVLIFESDRRAVGACLLANAKTMHGFLRIKRLSLNASGEASADTTYSEYNDILCLPGWESAVTEALFEELSSRKWDEIALDGFSDGPAYRSLKEKFVGFECEEVQHPSYYVDLVSIRESGIDFDMSLGKTSRKHLRQNIRHYSAIGDLRLEVAQNVPEALTMLDEIARLSQMRWDSQGKRGIFSSERFYAFHRMLIEKSFSSGAVQLLRVLAGDQAVGLVYNLIQRGRVHFYQCGYHYGPDKRLSPGTVTLSRVIQYCLDEGYRDFDFLSGETSYKQSLSTGSRTLSWTVFRRPRLRLQAIDVLRRIKLQLTQANN